MSYMNRFVLASLALAAVIATFGCKKEEVAANSTVISKPAVSTPASGGDGKEFTASGASINLPKDWTGVDLTKKDFDKAMDQGTTAENKDLMEKAKQAAASGMIKMMAFAPKEVNGFRDNLNLIIAPSSNTVKEEMDATVKVFEGGGRKVLSSGVVTLPAGEAATYAAELKNAQGTYVAVGYIVHHGSDAYVFTISGKEAEHTKQIAEAAMKTVHF